MPTDEPWRDAVAAVIAGCTRVSLDEAFAHVREALGAGAPAAHAADLALACAAARGDAVATRRVADLIATEAAAAARSVDGNATFADEIAQCARVRLLVGEDSAPPRIAGYRGAGPLRAWIGIAARRIALNARRDASGERRSHDDVLADVVDREPDPELRHLKSLYRSQLQAALARALTGLGDRPRTLLRLRFVEGLELAQIGRLYRVHESTASRWISAALDEVTRATREHLIAGLGVGAETADSVARIVHSKLDLSIARLLR